MEFDWEKHELKKPKYERNGVIARATVIETKINSERWYEKQTINPLNYTCNQGDLYTLKDLGFVPDKPHSIVFICAVTFNLRE